MKSVSDCSIPKDKKMKLKGTSKETSLKQKRSCLKCGEKFPSKGPYNRVCDKCSSMNERVANSTYVVRESIPSDSTTVEKRFYELN
jgi:hypothetical protein